MSKETKNKIVPRLRFQEFIDNEGWIESDLNSIAELIDERAGKNEYTLMSVSSGYGLISQKEKFGREIAGSQYKNYYVIREWDFAYNKSATKLYPEGYISMLRHIDTAAVPNSIFTCFRINKTLISPQYLNYLFHDNFHGKWLRKFIEVGARAHGSLNVDNKVLFRMPVVFPSKKEQQKIAVCLSSIDDLIAAHIQKLDALKAHKKGLMQQLFPAEGEKVPELRFKEFNNKVEWEVDALGNVSKSYSGGTPSTTQKNFYGGDIPFIRSSDINNESTELFLTQDGLEKSSAKLIRKGDLLIALYGANSGDVALAKIDGAINQAILCLRSSLNIPFIYHYLFFRKNWIVGKYIQGGQGNLSGEIIKSILFPYPNSSEQQKIADCLSSIDDLINAQNKKIEALQTHKKGLMQQLFPSSNRDKE
jgi:type I restriction enzyme S subunit